MRDVRSKNYFEQMKGRGVRSLAYDDLKRVSQTVRHTKTHFVLIDAIGAVKSKKTDSRPLERKSSVPLKELLDAVAIGARDEDLFSSLANRLIRLEKQLSDAEKEGFRERSDGETLRGAAARLLAAHDPDHIDDRAQPLIEARPKEERSPGFEAECRRQAQEQLAREAARPFTGEVNEYLEQVRRVHEQIIDSLNPDQLLHAGWDTDSRGNADAVVGDFRAYIEAHKDEITALQFFYAQPYTRRGLSYTLIKSLLDTLKRDKPQLAPHVVWEAYARLEEVNGNRPKNELVALVSLLRRVSGLDATLTAFQKTVDKNFQDWIFKKHSGAGEKFSDAQMEMLRLLKEHISSSFHVVPEDLDFHPFDALGGRGRMFQLFGDTMGEILNELNEGLVA
jgi:type I restriction enzyme R subunit